MFSASLKSNLFCATPTPKMNANNIILFKRPPPGGQLTALAGAGGAILAALRGQSANLGKSLDRSRPAVAGLVGGSVATLVLHPLELLKTRQAVHCNGGEKAARERYARLGGAVKSILKNEGGLRGLYSGVGVNVFMAGSSWGVYFMSYNAIKSTVMKQGAASNLPEQILAAFGAGIFTTLLVNPLGVIRTRMVMQPNQPNNMMKKKATLRQIVAQTWKKEGPKAFFKGLVPSLLGVSHGALQILTYEEIKKRIVATDKRPTTAETLLSCCLSKLLAAAITYPLQNLRCCLQASSEPTNRGCLEVARAAGVRGLYRGITPYLMHVVPNVCLVFLVYEAVAGRIE